MTKTQLDEEIWNINDKITDWKYEVKLSGKEEDALQDLFRAYERLAQKLFLLTNKDI